LFATGVRLRTGQYLMLTRAVLTWLSTSGSARSWTLTA